MIFNGFRPMRHDFTTPSRRILPIGGPSSPVDFDQSSVPSFRLPNCELDRLMTIDVTRALLILALKAARAAWYD
jgi:hypothetical protein